jgi:hypothetical protein
MGVVTLAAIAWLFAGFGVFWLRTGSGRIGEGGTYNLAGLVVWLAPLVLVRIGYVIGPLGPLRSLWEDPVRLVLDDRGVAWTLIHDPSGFASWDEVGGMSSDVDWRGPWRSLRRRDGAELVTVRGPFVDEATGRTVVLPTLLVRLHPELFEPLEARHPDRACIRRATA